jgi:hypothetical protein
MYNRNYLFSSEFLITFIRMLRYLLLVYMLLFCMLNVLISKFLNQKRMINIIEAFRAN